MTDTRRKLGKREAPLSGALRVFRIEVERIEELLVRANVSSLTEGEVHELRALTKAARAHWGLLRGVVERSEYRSTDERLAAIARGFSGAREAAVRRAAFANLAKRPAIDPMLATKVSQFLLTRDALAPIARTQQSRGSSEPTTAGVPLPQVRIPAKGQRRLTLRALRRGYRQGRQALQLVVERGTAATAAELHRLRKRAKFHLNQLKLLRASGSLRQRQQQLKLLCELLGSHQDLADLEQYLKAAPPELVSTGDVSTVVATSEQQRSALRQHAVALGDALYGRKPRRLARWLGKRAIPSVV